MLHQSTLISILRSRRSIYKQLCRERNTSAFIEWLPIFHYRPPSTSLVRSYGLLVESGGWVAGDAERRILFPTEHYGSFIVLVETPYRLVVQQLRDAIRAAGLPPNVVYTFPLDHILACALSASGYWANLGEAWLTSGYPPNDELARLAPRNRAVWAWQARRRTAIFDESIGPSTQ